MKQILNTVSAYVRNTFTCENRANILTASSKNLQCILSADVDFVTKAKLSTPYFRSMS
ncbi:MAG: hypothetical protein ACI4QI_03820 [Candidatus Coproplasma sp.]